MERELAVPSVWEDQGRAQALAQERANLAEIVTVLSDLDNGLAEFAELAELAEDAREILRARAGG